MKENWFEVKLLQPVREHRNRIFQAARQQVEEESKVGPTPVCLGFYAFTSFGQGKATEDELRHIAGCWYCRACTEGYNSPRRWWKRFCSKLSCRWSMFLYRLGWRR